MRDLFPEYYPRTIAEYDDLWSRALIVPDTNILLHLFRYGADTQNDILNTLEALRARLFVPYQVALEFSRNYQDIDAASQGSYEKFKRDLQASGNSMAAIFNDAARHPIIDPALEKKKIQQFVDDLCSHLDECAKRHPSKQDREAVLEKVMGLTDGVVDAEPSTEALEAMMKNGALRFSSKIPPGYADAKKPSPDCYGDYFIWEAMIEVAKVRSLPIIFISDEVKGDWVKESGGPRPELVREFYKRAGQHFLLYGLTDFLKYAEKYTSVAVSEDSLTEIAEEARKDASVEASIAAEASTVRVDPFTGNLRFNSAAPLVSTSVSDSSKFTIGSSLSVEPFTGNLKFNTGQSSPNWFADTSTFTSDLTLSVDPLTNNITLNTAHPFITNSLVDSVKLPTTSTLTVDPATGYLMINTAQPFANLFVGGPKFTGVPPFSTAPIASNSTFTVSPISTDPLGDASKYAGTENPLIVKKPVKKEEPK